MRRLGLATMGVLACVGNPQESAEGPASSTTTEVPGPSGQADASESGSGSAPDGDTGDPSGTMVPECGDAIAEAPEECDDGNLVGGDGCEPDCSATIDTALWQDEIAGRAGLREAGQAIAVDGMGDVVVVGFVQNQLDQSDVWIRKYTADGDIVWTQTLDPSAGEEDRGLAVAIASDASIAVAGSTTVSPGRTDLWIARLSATGQTMWSTTSSGGEGSGGAAFGVTVTSDDTVVAVGSARASLNDPDIEIVRLHGNDGSPVAAQRFAGPASLEDRASAVISVDEGFVVAGFVGKSGFDQDVWLRRYGSDGTEVWTTTFDGEGHGPDFAFALAAAPDGTFAVAGTTPGGVPGTADAWLGKFDANGELLFQKTFGGPAVLDDEARGVAVDADGDIIVVGSKSVTSLDTDMWLQKWTAAGDKVWTQNVAGEGSSFDRAFAVQTGSDGRFYVTGEIRPEPTNDGDIWVGGFGP